MQTTQLADGYPSALAVPFQSTESVTALSDLIELEQLIDQELKNDSPGDPCTAFPVSSAQIEREAALLRRKQLSHDLKSWVDSYTQVGDRTLYLWTWCRQGAEATTLHCVSPSSFDELCDTKVIAMMFDVLLDDIADQGGDTELLEQLVALPFSNKPFDWRAFTNKEQKYAAFSELVWNEVQQRVERFPRYDEFADLLRYDYLQLMNTMRYSHLLNRIPSLLNLAEHDLYLPHNMMMMICATMDLMCSPEFDFNEIGYVRQATWHAQCMGRIGNQITTWEREIHEADFTSGVFARAVIHGDLSLEQLATGDQRVIKRAIREGQHEEYFLRQWREHREKLLDLHGSVLSVDLKLVVQGLERLISLHLASRGLK